MSRDSHAVRAKRSIYTRRVKKSHCRGRTTRCTRATGCKKTRSGKRKSYCRKSSNRRA